MNYKKKKIDFSTLIDFYGIERIKIIKNNTLLYYTNVITDTDIKVAKEFASNNGYECSYLIFPSIEETKKDLCAHFRFYKKNSKNK